MFEFRPDIAIDRIGDEALMVFGHIRASLPDKTWTGDNDECGGESEEGKGITQASEHHSGSHHSDSRKRRRAARSSGSMETTVSRAV